MANKRRLLSRLLLTVSVLGGLAIAVCLGVALSELWDGPSRSGYDLLAIAVGAMPFLAAVVVLTVILASIGTRVRFAVGGLALTSGVVGGVAMGLVGIGSSLNSIDPLHQPPALNSLILAVYGVGTQIAPVALILAFGALALVSGTWLARRVTSTSRAAIPAAAV